MKVIFIILVLAVLAVKARNVHYSDGTPTHHDSGQRKGDGGLSMLNNSTKIDMFELHDMSDVRVKPIRPKIDYDSPTEADDWNDFIRQPAKALPIIIDFFRKINTTLIQLPIINDMITITSSDVNKAIKINLYNGNFTNITDIHRYGNAQMKIENGIIKTRMYLYIKSVDFEYSFTIETIPFKGPTRAYMYVHDLVVRIEINIGVIEQSVKVQKFNLLNFGTILTNLKASILNKDTVVDWLIQPINDFFESKLYDLCSKDISKNIHKVLDMDLVVNPSRNTDLLEKVIHRLVQ